MPVDSSTYQKYYNALQQAYGKDGAVEKGAFNLGYDDFKQKLANQEYAQKIYGALDQAYGKQGIVEKDAFTLPFNDFYKKVTQPNQKAQVPIPATSTIPSFDVQMQNLTDQSGLEAHGNRVQQASNNLIQTFNEDKDKAISNIIVNDLNQKQKQLNASYQDGMIDEKTYNEGRKKLFNQIVNPTVAIGQFKQDLNTDQEKVRQVVHEIAKSNPNKANQLKADMYLLDSKNRPEKANLILQNANNILEGKDIDYDIKKGNLQHKEGFFASLGQGFTERNRMMRDYEFYNSETPENIINQLEGQRASYDPDLPVNTPYGIGGHLGQAIGSQGIVTAKGAVAGAATSLVPVAGEMLAPWMAATVTSPEFYKTGWTSSFENNYHRARNEGVNPAEAYKRARQNADFDALADVAQGVASTAVGTRIGLKPGEFSPTFQNSIKNIAVHSGKWLTETGTEGGANALIAGGLQELKNIHAGRPAEEGAFETGMGQLMFTYGLGALTKAGRTLLNPKAYRSILQTMARAPENEINGTLAGMIKDGSITNDDAIDIHSQITAQHAADSKIPQEVTNDNDRAKIQDLISQRDALDAKMESIDKAYHPELKEEIKALNEKISELSKKPSEEPTKPSAEPTFSQPEDQQRLHENEILSQLKSPTHGEETKGNAQTEGQINEKPSEGADVPKAVETAPSIQPESWARTLDYGENKGQQENKAARDKINEQILNDEPIGNTGERFSQLLGRVIPGIKKVMAEDQHNTTIVTHSSVIKALQVWEEMGRPDISELTGEKLKEFAQKYIDRKPESEGKVHTFKSDNGNEIKVVRHGETEDNKLSEFRDDNTQLTDKGIAQAKNAGANLVRETAGNIPKIITSDLPRTLHTSDIINEIIKENAIRKSKTESVLQREQGPNASAWGERGRMEQGEQGAIPAGESSGQPPEEVQGTGEKTSPEPIAGDELPFGRLPVGIAHHLQEERAAAELNVAPPERGEGITLEQSIQRGKDLIASGVNPDQIAANFKKDNRLNSDDMAIVRARYNELANKTNRAYDQYGEGSPQAKAAFTAERAWYNDAVKPMQTEWHKIGVSQQSAIDLDTGSITSFHRAWSEVNKQPMTESQEKTAEKLVEDTKQRTEDADNVKDKLDHLHDKATQSKEPNSIKEDAKKLADKIRQNAKLNKPGMFSAATPASLVWDSGVEIVAKSIEAGGVIADAIKKGIDFVKQSDWYKNLSTGEQKEAINQFKDWHRETGMSNEEKLADLKKGVNNNISRIRRQIENKERIAKLEKKPIHTDEEYRRLKEDEKALQSLLDKYLPEKPEKYADQKALKRREKMLTTQISDLNDQINRGERDIKAKGPEDTDYIKQLKEIKKIKEEQLDDITSNTEFKKTAEEMALRFANKSDNKFTPQEAKDVWGYVRSRYLDKENMSFGDALRATAADLGLSRNQILSAIASPKGAKAATTELWKKNYEQRKAQAFAKRFIETGNQSDRKRLWNNLPTYFFASKTAGHGTVGNVTHSGTNIFRPSTWSAYWPNVLRSFKLAYGKAGDFEKAVDDFIARPNFDKWNEAKLAIDPRKSYDNYQVFGLKKNWFLDTGNRGFTGLKFMRYDMAELFYNRLSDTEKADPQAREKIAELVNHSTGHSDFNLNVKIGEKTYKPLNVLAFAPGLEVSRWQNVYDPIKAVGTLTNWKKASPAELAAAKIALGGAIEKTATYGAILAANAGFLSFIGSKQKVNIDDPTKSDFLRLKGFDKTIDVTGNAASPIRLVAGVLYQAYRSVHPDKSRTSPSDKDIQTIGQQLRYKASPIAEFGADVATGQDAMGNIMPWSSVKPGKGKYKMDWGEYATQQLPIPLASGAKEVYDGMRERGMSAPQANDFMNGLLQAGVEMFSGAKVQHDYSLDKKGGGTTSGGGAGGSFR